MPENRSSVPINFFKLGLILLCAIFHRASVSVVMPFALVLRIVSLCILIVVYVFILLSMYS